MNTKLEKDLIFHSRLNEYIDDPDEKLKSYEEEFASRGNEMPLDDFAYHEAFDRTFSIMHTFNELVVEHPVVQQHPVLLSMAGEVNKRLFALYKLIADKEGLFSIKEAIEEYKESQILHDEMQQEDLDHSKEELLE